MEGWGLMMNKGYWRHQELIPFLPHCLMGNLWHVLHPARLSVHIVHVVPRLNRGPWAMYPVWVKELHHVHVLPAKMRKLCSPSTDKVHYLQKVWSLPHKGQQMMLSPPEMHRRIVSFLSVWFTWRHLEDCSGFAPFSFCSAWSKNMPLHFASRFPYSDISKLQHLAICEGKKKHNLSGFP